MWSLIATWPFSLAPVQEAAKALKNGGDAMDAVVRVGPRVEADPEVSSVGFGGIPNRDGQVELDAAVMDGRTLNLGAVAGIKHYRNPIRIARDVLEKTPHTLLVGAGAEDFACRMGYETTEVMTTPKCLAEWEELRAKQAGPSGHDTVGIVALDEAGHLCAGTSTSGLSMKLPGRVGDSPLVGAGFYADEAVGGAAATGVGEDIMKGLLSFRTVELMRLGLSPKEAVEAAVADLHRRLLARGVKPGNMSVVCMNRAGEMAAASNFDGFDYSVASQGQEPELIHCPDVLGQ